MNTVYDEMQKLVDESDYDTRLAITAWVFKNIVDHARDGGSYRYLIYDRLGFDIDSYLPLYEAGGMEISNEFDLNLKYELTKVVRENDYARLKPLLGLCDVDECYKSASCGWPSDNGYRHTCGEHMEK